MDPYYSRWEVSNSDLIAMDRYFSPPQYVIDSEDAYRFGTLVDCLITEPEKVNLWKRTCEGYIYTQAEIELAMNMSRRFFKDPSCAAFAEVCEFQAISTRENFRVTWGRFSFEISGVRCKWDLLCRRKKWGGDIKSTFATTQKQFEAACEYFHYFQSRAFYMDIEGTEKDILIGISKENDKIFKIPIRRGGKYYEKGKEQYESLLFQYWSLFEGLEVPAA